MLCSGQRLVWDFLVSIGRGGIYLPLSKCIRPRSTPVFVRYCAGQPHLSYDGAPADKAKQDRPLPARGGCFSGVNRSDHLPNPGHHSVHSGALPLPGASLCDTGWFTSHSRHVSNSPTYSLAAGRNPLRPI